MIEQELAVNTIRRFLLLLLLCLPGCINLSYGSKNPTMADELAELRKMRKRGEITAREFEIGKYTVLNQAGPQPPTHATVSGTQIATAPFTQDATQPQ